MRLIGLITIMVLLIGCSADSHRPEGSAAEYSSISLHWEAVGPSNDVRWCDLLGSGQRLALDTGVVLETRHFAGARVAHDEAKNTYVVEVVMTEEGRRRMKELSSSNLGRRLAIVLDDDIVALATVSHPIDSDALNLPTMTDSATAEKVSGEIKKAIEGI
jgi:hypothetical protein